jgi:FtsH-binding integral membrane protein
MSGQKGMKSIWYFVGLILITMGGLVLLAGILDMVSPPARTTVLAGLHTSLWWGMIMVVVGVVFFLSSRKRTIS